MASLPDIYRASRLAGPPTVGQSAGFCGSREGILRRFCLSMLLPRDAFSAPRPSVYVRSLKADLHFHAARSRGDTACRALRAARSMCTEASCCSAGTRIPGDGPPLGTLSASWRRTEEPMATRSFGNRSTRSGGERPRQPTVLPSSPNSHATGRQATGCCGRGGS